MIFLLFISNGKKTGRNDVPTHDDYANALKKLMAHANKNNWSNQVLDEWMDKNRNPELLIIKVRKLTGDSK